jgi:hypothetical protein
LRFCFRFGLGLCLNGFSRERFFCLLRFFEGLRGNRFGRFCKFRFDWRSFFDDLFLFRFRRLHCRWRFKFDCGTEVRP